jgi:hypothetical protein
MSMLYPDLVSFQPSTIIQTPYPCPGALYFYSYSRLPSSRYGRKNVWIRYVRVGPGWLLRTCWRNYSS